ncbi:MAG: ATP-binding protein, partial [Ruminococcus sp.]|nr:ATP-binding protein [Ruminococcus sp.]
IDNSNVLIDCIPIKEKDDIIGAVAILHNREEYTKLMEDLAGTRYLVDSMRANNHDFTNKLHVIMGLIQMEMYDDAVSYIENISIVQRETISKIMSVVDEPSIAALLIGKSARASELNIKFILNDESHYSKTDLLLPSELMVTVIGNLIDNAFEAINIKDIQRQKELRFGIYSRENALLITVEDTGIGISKDNLEHIYDNGFSTKGEGRGTGLYQVKEMVEAIGGKITVESRENVGTSFTVIFQNKS